MQLATKLWARLATCATHNNMAELSGTWTVLSSRIVHDRRRDKTRFTNCRSPEPCIKLICKLCGRSWGRSFRTRIARERITRGLIPAKRRLIASFKLALVKVCQGQGQGQFKIPDPATATAIARVRFRVRGSVSAASRLRRDYRSPARSLWGSTVLYLYLYLKIYNFFACLLQRFNNVLMNFICAACRRRSWLWSWLSALAAMIVHAVPSEHLSIWTSTLPSVQLSSAQSLSSSIFSLRSGICDLRSECQFMSFIIYLSSFLPCTLSMHTLSSVAAQIADLADDLNWNRLTCRSITQKPWC